MAYLFGPSKKWQSCKSRVAECGAVRSTQAKTIDLLIRDLGSLDELVFRMSRPEAESLMEALRRVLGSDVSCASWDPAVIAAESKP